MGHPLIDDVRPEPPFSSNITEALRRASEEPKGTTASSITPPLVPPPAPLRSPSTYPKMFTGRELRAMTIVPPEFVVEDLVPKGLSILAGKQKTGKSWLLLDLALNIARGGTFLDTPVAQGDVLYLALEDHAPRLWERLGKLDPDGNWGGEHLTFCTAMENLGEGGVEFIHKWLQDAANPRLVILDVFGRAAPENKSKRDEYTHISMVLGELQRLAFDFGIALIVVTHMRKGGRNENEESDDPIDEVMGSAAMTSNSDNNLLLFRQRGTNAGRLRVISRDTSEKTLPLRFDENGCRWHRTEAQDSGVRLTAKQEEVLEAVKTGCSTVPEIAQHLGVVRTAPYPHLATLVNLRLLEKRNERYSLPRIPEVFDTALEVDGSEGDQDTLSPI